MPSGNITSTWPRFADLLGPLQRLAVGRLTVHRKDPEGEQEPADRRLPQLSLAMKKSLRR